MGRFYILQLPCIPAYVVNTASQNLRFDYDTVNEFLRQALPRPYQPHILTEQRYHHPWCTENKIFDLRISNHSQFEIFQTNPAMEELIAIISSKAEQNPSLINPVSGHPRLLEIASSMPLTKDTAISAANITKIWKLIVNYEYIPYKGYRIKLCPQSVELELVFDIPSRFRSQDGEEVIGWTNGLSNGATRPRSESFIRRGSACGW